VEDKLISNGGEHLTKTIERLNFCDPTMAIVEINDLINSCVGDNSTSSGKIWKEFSSDRPNYKQYAKILLEASGSLDPLATLSNHRLLRTKLRSRLLTIWAGQKYRKRGYPSELESNNWDDLPDKVQSSVRSELKLLASRERAKVHRGRPRKNDLDALVEGLADIFASQTGHSLHIDRLAHAVESQFIQFATDALAGAGYVDDSERTGVAIARRWARIKVHNQTGYE
jgi:hypothetical protein